MADNMADGEDSGSDEPDRTPLSPIVGTPCEELDAADIFEGHVANRSRLSFEELSYLSPPSEGDSAASSDQEENYTQELGCTPPRNVRRIKEKNKTVRKGQGLCLKLPDVKAEAEKQKKRERDRNRETSQTQLRTERAFMRQYKRNSLGNTFSHDVDLSKSLNLPSVKIESRRFMSLKCTRQDKEKGRLKRSESDPKNLGQISDGNLSQHRQEFLRTFSLLIKIGAHARQHKDNQFALTEVERQTSEEQKQWQVKLCLALWLELRAWHSGRTMEEQDRFLVEERAHVNHALDRIINFDTKTVISSGECTPSMKDAGISFNVRSQPRAELVELIVTDCDNETDRTNSSGSQDNRNESDKEKEEKTENDSQEVQDSKTRRTKLKLTLQKHSIEEESTTDKIYQSAFSVSNIQDSEVIESKPANIESTPVQEGDMKQTASETKTLAQHLETAMNCIDNVFEELEAAERLYSTQRALGEANPKYFSDIFNTNHDALVLWANMTKDMLHKLTLVARFIGIEQGVSKELWQDWYNVGMGMLG